MPVTADISKVKRNISKMIDQGAPKDHIDAYLKSEGLSAMDLRIKGVESIKDDPAKIGILRTALDQFNQGTTSGWGDEITDRIGSAVAAPFVDETYAELLPQAREMSKRDLAAQQKENPWVSGLSNVGGALTGAAALSKVLPNAVTSRASTFAKANPAKAAMLVGGSGAGVYSAGSSKNEGLERLNNLAIDIPLGMVGGYAGYRAAQALPALASGLKEKAKTAGRALGLLDDEAPKIADVIGDAVNAADASTMEAVTPKRLAGILDEEALSKLDDGQVLPLTAGDRTQNVLQQRAEQTAATFGAPDSPINLARQTQKEAMKKPFVSMLGSEQPLNDLGLDLRAQDEALAAANLVRGQYDDLGRRVNSAYKMAREGGGGVGISAKTVEDNFLGGVSDILGVENVLKGDIPRLDKELENLTGIINPAGADGKPFKLDSLSLNALEAWKKRLNRAYNNTAEPADKRILQMVSNQYDTFLSDLADDAIVNGDETAIKAFKNARGLAKEKFAFYESDKAVQKILDNRDLSGSQLMNVIMGASKLGGTGEGGRLVETMLNLAGDKAPEMHQSLQKGFMARILKDSVGSVPESRSVFDMAGAMQKSLNGLMKNRESFEAIFDETERKYFKQMSEDLGKIAGKQIGAINRSGSGTYASEAVSGLANVLGNPILSKMTGGLGGALSGGLRAGLEKKAADELLNKAESGLNEFLTEAVKQIDAPAVYYGAYAGQAAVDPLFNAVGQTFYGSKQ
jgi:hypothetical protein